MHCERGPKVASGRPPMSSKANCAHSCLTGRVALALLILLSTAVAATAQTDRDEVRLEEPRDGTASRPISVELRVAGVFDSNIDHDEDDLDSLGSMLAARVRLRTRRLSMYYQAGFDRFSETARWDRFTHRARAEIRQRLRSDLRVGSLAELSIGNSSEDRETLGNQYTIMPWLEHRIGDSRRWSVHGAYRFRTFGELAQRNDETWYWGGEFTQNIQRQSWTAGYRYERTQSRLPTNSYSRHAYEAQYEFRPSTRDDVRLGLMLRPRHYPERVVELPAGETSRRDRRWTTTTEWIRTRANGVETGAAYEFDWQTSTDPEKPFRAHRVTFTVGWIAD
jgi:hypothetical protein